MRARVYVRTCVYMISGQIAIRTNDHDQHTTGTQDHQKREEHGRSIKTKFVIVGRSKRQKRKKVKKSLELIKKVVSL